MRLASVLLGVSAVLFAGLGIAYLVAPGFMLSIVGMESGASSDFLLRTEGVGLLAGAGLIYAVMRSGARAIRIGLLALAAYYILGSVVDLAAYLNGLLEAPSLASIVARLVFGGVCLYATSTADMRASSE